MAGIYFHVPFCKSRCIYCDFYSITDLSLIDTYIDAVIYEIESRRNEVQWQVESIYFGGGTPSLLSPKHLQRIFDAIFKFFFVASSCEITLEANPDDVNDKIVKIWYQCGINRVSLGVQSFENDILSFLKRRHNVTKAKTSIDTLLNQGIENISIDLIYGIPGFDIKIWQKTLNEAVVLPVKHISAYHLTIEKGTILEKMKINKSIVEVSEEESYLQYQLLCSILGANGFEHYELSNFALQGYYSRHNSTYWLGKPYVGIGPSAHSYNGTSRRWNTSSLIEYITNINKQYFETEILSSKDKFNEYLITRLRTKKGGLLNELKEIDEAIYKSWMKQYEIALTRNLVKSEGQSFYISSEQWFICDYVLKFLMV